MSTDNTRSAIWDELDAAAMEYAAAKAEFDRATIRFEIAKKRLAVTKQVAADVMVSVDLFEWLEAHESVRYAGSPLGDAIVEVLRRHAYQVLVVYYATYEKGVSVSLNLDQIVNALRAGGFEFRTLTPLREVNAALINLSGVEKLDGNLYRYRDLEVLEAEVRETLADDERRERNSEIVG